VQLANYWRCSYTIIRLDSSELISVAIYLLGEGGLFCSVGESNVLGVVHTCQT
jgi:hypothetical protein